MTLTSPRVLKPSSWFNKSNIVRWISRLPPMSSHTYALALSILIGPIIPGDLPIGTDDINLIDEDDTWRMILSNSESLTHKVWSISEVLLNEFRANDSQKQSRCLICELRLLGSERLACNRNTIQDDALWWSDSHLFVEFKIRQGKFHRFLQVCASRRRRPWQRHAKRNAPLYLVSDFQVHQCRHMFPWAPCPVSRR